MEVSFFSRYSLSGASAVNLEFIVNTGNKIPPRSASVSKAVIAFTSSESGSFPLSRRPFLRRNKDQSSIHPECVEGELN